MKLVQRLTLAAVIGAGILLPGVARADAVKAETFVLGIHLGNANGVLYSLLNSYDQSKRAHPNAVPLLRRQFNWSIDLAKKMKLPTAALEALERDLDKLEFSGMNMRLQPILQSYRVALSKFGPTADDIFELGIQLTLAGAVNRHAMTDRQETWPRWRQMMATLGGTMAGNITNNKLEATLSFATEWTTRVNRGDSFQSLATYNGDTVKRWQEDFAKAPGFGGGVVGTVIARVGGQLTKGDPLDTVRKGHHAKVHTVNLHAGATYTIDLESGNGSAGPQNPGYFDVWLRVEDANGKVLFSNDDGGEGFNARVTFTAQYSGTYRLVVTSYSKGATGNYTLKVTQR